VPNRELREWLGLTLADLLVYLGTAAVLAMYFVKDSTLDALLAMSAIALTLAACPLGMKRDPQVSDFTNSVKSWAYPICVLVAIVAIVSHYAWFQPTSA